MADTEKQPSNDRLQWSKMKDRPLKEKLEYFFTYYGWHIFAVAFGLLLTASLTVALVSNRDTVILTGDFYTQVMEDNNPQAFTEALCNELELNPKRSRVALSGTYLPEHEELDAETKYAANMRLSVKTSAKGLDFWAAGVSQFMEYIHPEDPSNNFCADLTTVLSAEQLETLKQLGRLRTVELNGTEVPLFIDIGSSRLAEMMGVTTDECLICFIVTSPHADAFRAMINLLIDLG